MTKHLTSEQRYEIYLGYKRRWNKSRIAREIDVHPSTVSRELRRNSNARGEYVWCNAQGKADARPQGLSGNHRKPLELWWRIEQMIIDEDWSPAQITGVLRKEGIHIVKQTIYNHVHADTTGKLMPHMPHRLKYTRRHKALRPTKATNIANRTSIHLRPAEADGKRFGDWEMDTVVDSYGHAILTLYGALNQLHSHGEAEARTQSHACGTCCDKAAVPIPFDTLDYNNVQRVRVCGT